MGEETATSARPPRLRGAAALVALAVTLLLALVLSACGDDPERQDADEPDADFPVEVEAAKFPARQRLAQTRDLELILHNAGSETIPDLAVTIHTGDEGADGSFNVRSDQPGLANPNRPVWILENGFPKLVTKRYPRGELDRAPTAGAEVAQTNTYSFGPLEPDESIDVVWRVTPVQAGTYGVGYELAAGLAGKARAVTEDGGPVEGEFVVTIAGKAPRARVNEAGQVEIQGE